MADMQAPTLSVLRDGVPIFTSHSKWLHPLFELEDYLDRIGKCIFRFQKSP